MLISYNWLKWYVPDVPAPDKLSDIFTYHICEVESIEKKGDDTIFDINILPNRAHDLLSHQGVARELASLLNIKYVDPTPKYKIPESKPTNLKINVEIDACKRYMGRIIRNIKVGPSPAWVVQHLESIGERSINNIVDATNIVMFDCGEPTHVFDLDKVKGSLIVRIASDGETITTLDGKECTLSSSDFVVADEVKALIIGGVKGGKVAEVDNNTKNIVLEVGNFDAVTVRKTSARLGIRTEGSKRWENGVSPELASYGMLELSALIAEMCPDAIFEDIVDVYPNKQEVKKLSFSVDRISKILGLKVSDEEIEDILKRYVYVYEYVYEKGVFTITIPPMRLDLVIEEDMAEEIGRILAYDKVKPIVPKINFTPKINETYAKIVWARNKLLNEGYSEVMTTTFCNAGEVEVQKSASDKNFLRTNLTDGLKESLKLNKINAPLLGLDEVKIFEIGTIFKKSGEEMHVVYADKKEVTETALDEFCRDMPEAQVKSSGAFALGDTGQGTHDALNSSPEPSGKFKMWSLFPFIARDVAVWVPEGVKSEDVEKILKDNIGDMVIRGPELFDEFKKGDQVSYAFRLIFQSYDRTLTDAEVNEVMDRISEKIKENKDWQVR